MQTYVLITNSDINKALLSILTAQGASVLMLSRRPFNAPNVEVYPLDIDNEHSFDSLFSKINLGHVTVINAIGLLHDDEHLPEKTLLHVEPDWFLKSMKVNCLSHIHCLKSLTSRMKRESRVNYIALSARVGSISDNQLGGWLSYRASKSALNMVIRTVSIEWKFKFPKSCVVGYHPGTVDTKLSRPFNKSAYKVFSAEQAAQYLYDFLQTLSPQKSGFIYDWENKNIEF